MDLIFKTTFYLDDKSINKSITEEYFDLNQNELIELVNDIIFDRFVSHNIHLSDKNKRTYRIDNTVMTLKQLNDFIKIEESKYDFLDKVKSEIINSNQLIFDFNNNNNNNNNNCTSLEYDIPNEWLSHHKIDLPNNRYKILINIHF